MAEKRTRRRFTAEFKAQAVERVLDGGKGLTEVAIELGLSTGQLSTWHTEHLAARKADEAEMQRLKRENRHRRLVWVRPSRRPRLGPGTPRVTPCGQRR